MNDVLEKLAELSATQREILTNQSIQQKQLDNQAGLLQTQSETLLRNTLTVEEHHKRSTLLEQEVKRLDTAFDDVKMDISNTKAVWKAYMWMFGTVGGFIAAAAGLYEIFHH